MLGTEEICEVRSMGYCLNERGEDQNSGTLLLSPGNCLEQCKKHEGATGCEDYQGGRACLVHTSPLSTGSNSNSNFHCWVFEKCGKWICFGINCFHCM